MEKENEFESLPVKRLIWNLGIPAMLAQLFNILYSIVDRIYIGHMKTGAETALASIGICSPAASGNACDCNWCIA